MRNLLIYIAFTSFMLLYSCEEEVLFEAKNFRPKIVLNSVFTNDSVWVIHLSHTTNVFDKETIDNSITDASIAITDKKGFQVCQLYHAGKGEYRSLNCTSNKAEEYKISVSSKKYGYVEATSRIPLSSKIEDLKVEVSTEYQNANEIQFKIKDNSSSANNFYIWSIVDVDTLRDKVVSGNVKLDFKLWVDEIKEQVYTVSGGKVNSALALTYEEIGATQNVTKLVTTKLKDRVVSSNEKSIVPMIKLMTVSPELYDYYKSMENYLKYNSSQNSVIEPQKLYSNVKGGSGIFAGYSIQYFNLPK